MRGVPDRCTSIGTETAGVMQNPIRQLKDSNISGEEQVRMAHAINDRIIFRQKRRDPNLGMLGFSIELCGLCMNMLEKSS